jgi:hypothetical protein
MSNVLTEPEQDLMDNPTEPIDWSALAHELGTICGPDEVGTEIGGRKTAREAIERLIGPARLAGAVDYYVSFQPGFELARSVLWHVRPWSAMVRCREIFASEADIQARRSAVELLRVVADRRVLPRISEFLADPDAGIQARAIGILDQLVFSRLVEDEECASILEATLNHSNPRVQEMAADIREQLAKGA